MTYIFDLDGTLLHSEDGYGNASCKVARVGQLKKLYQEGHTIVIQTARSKFWKKFTEKQLAEWNIPYHVLSVGDKIYGDVYIDDKGIKADDFFK